MSPSRLMTLPAVPNRPILRSLCGDYLLGNHINILKTLQYTHVSKYVDSTVRLATWRVAGMTDRHPGQLGVELAMTRHLDIDLQSSNVSDIG